MGTQSISSQEGASKTRSFGSPWTQPPFPKPSRSSQSPALPRATAEPRVTVTTPATTKPKLWRKPELCGELPKTSERAEMSGRDEITTGATSPALPPPLFPHRVPAMSQHPKCLSKEVALLLSGPNCHGEKSPRRFISNRKTFRQQAFPSHNLKTAKHHQISFLPSKKPCPETAHNN